MATPTVLDVEPLLVPIAGDNPSGRNLFYEPQYDELREARRVEDDTLQGDWKRKAKTADWDRVVELGSNLLKRLTKDLQIAAWMTEALARKRGLPGLRDGLILVRELQERFWDTYYPNIEDGDLESRSGPFLFLNNALPLVIRSVPLTDGLGERQYSFLHWQEARTTENVGLQDAEKMEELIAEGKTTSAGVRGRGGADASAVLRGPPRRPAAGPRRLHGPRPVQRRALRPRCAQPDRHPQGPGRLPARPRADRPGQARAGTEPRRRTRGRGRGPRPRPRTSPTTGRARRARASRARGRGPRGRDRRAARSRASTMPTAGSSTRRPTSARTTRAARSPSWSSGRSAWARSTRRIRPSTLRCWRPRRARPASRSVGSRTRGSGRSSSSSRSRRWPAPRGAAGSIPIATRSRRWPPRTPIARRPPPPSAPCCGPSSPTIPDLPDAELSDGTPAANAETRAWLRAEVLPAGPSPTPSRPPTALPPFEPPPRHERSDPVDDDARRLGRGPRARALPEGAGGDPADPTRDERRRDRPRAVPPQAPAGRALPDGQSTTGSRCRSRKTWRGRWTSSDWSSGRTSS